VPTLNPPPDPPLLVHKAFNKKSAFERQVEQEKWFAKLKSVNYFLKNVKDFWLN
jgi:hypothetical protein